ncbi:MAG: Uncharacterized protein G01um101444_16 [Parcubacteria group bacterium Gr01-1014_44]|nr:MAG: Uncharacterized protein G01um101444_16 [Parcubacteria group bacterium Gr01-1014_44]
MFMIFRKMREGIRSKAGNGRPFELSVALIFPIAFAFLLTFVSSRIFSHFAPNFYLLEVEPGLRVHHFAYGFFILAAAAYLALIHTGPRAKYLIALLVGFGLGLAFDEFGMWLRLRDDDVARWNYDGFNIIIGFFFVVLFAKPGIRFLKMLWPF